MTKRRPRVDLAVRLLADPADAEDVRGAFAADAPLRRYYLLSLRNEPNQTHTPLLGQYLSIDARIAAFLLDQNAIDEALRPHAELITRPTSPLSLSVDLTDRLKALAALPPTALTDPVLLLTGRTTMEQQQVAFALARSSGLNLLSVNLPALLSNMSMDTALTLAQREAALQPAALFLPSLNLLKTEQAEQFRTRLGQSRFAPLIVLGAEGSFNWPGMTIALPDPDYDARLKLWMFYLGAEAQSIETASLEKLAGKFKLSAQQIADAARAGRGHARWRCPAQPTLSIDDLYLAARSQSTPILNNLARKIVPHYGWKDIVL
ncbi:MAG TPA: hypothetical protein VII92_14655, partial [Anaerolineae bacterium]